ncbi:GAF domain-containing sensor histidine kinase [Alishewanella tabrizica]|uniref:histidine kinase n=1 Tax=Alishewanella tabrizica TaxID=671278 RepID=A0ABQ2WKQ6_9ALTE|nr:ATP-binding protein [Alishewanella tabrizica]GGW56919.1 two-component sensor histidine kinase [Alishewanella tabrizica]
MLTNEQLQEKLLQLSYEKKQLERFKFLNDLILSGLNAILSSDKHEQIFQKLFAVIHEVINCQHIILLVVDEKQQHLELLRSTNEQLSEIPIPLENLQNLTHSTLNFFNVKGLAWWDDYFAVTFDEVHSVLSHPFHTSQSHYVLLLLSDKRGAFSAQIQELLSSFTSFVANTLTQVETRRLISERDQLLQRQHRIEQSLLQQEKMASLGQLAAGVAHELNNPLGFIYSNLNTLKVYLADLEKVLKASQVPDASSLLKQTGSAIDVNFLLNDGKDLIDESLEGARRARDIINNLRSYSHPDDKKTTQMPLNQLLDSAVKIAKTQIKHNSVLQLTLSEANPSVIVNANQLNQVILNLIINANQAVSEGKGLINITSGQEASHCYFEIIDNGSGIPIEAQTRIFEPFFTTKDVGQGTGLGLSLSKAIIDQHGGQIELKHTGPSGTAFRVTLPVVIA